MGENKFAGILFYDKWDSLCTVPI